MQNRLPTLLPIEPEVQNDSLENAIHLGLLDQSNGRSHQLHALEEIGLADIYVDRHIFDRLVGLPSLTKISMDSSVVELRRYSQRRHASKLHDGVA